MSFYRGPSTILDGLIWSLDAGNPKSFVSGSLRWNDLSATKRSATFTASNPIYQEGSLNFDDTKFGYADSSYNFGSLSNWTVEAWAKIGKSLSGKVTTIVTNQYNLSTDLNFSLGTNNAPSTYNLVVGFFNGAWRNTTGHVPPLNTWFQIVGSYDGNTIRQYHNGILTSSLSYTGTSSTGGTVRIAARWDDLTQITSNYFSGSIAAVKIYNRALSQSEITQNYNSIKGRFNLT